MTIFTPEPFGSPILSPNIVSAYRAASYISPSWYRFAPTAVSTLALVPGSQNAPVDSTASLAQVIARASAMMDEYVFWRNDGSFSAFVSTEQDRVAAKPDGSLVLLANFPPVRAVVGIGVGPSSSQLANLTQSAANDIIVGNSTIAVPGYASSVLLGGIPDSGGPFSASSRYLAVYSYVAGWPHTTLTASAAAGATSITVAPSTPGGTQLLGAYKGTPLVIRDGASTETVVLAETPSSLTLNLSSPLQFAHSLPTAPDSTMVSAIPSSIEEACISLVSVILKMQGMRAQVPASLGSPSKSSRQEMGRAGALSDYDLACRLLKPYRTVYLH